MNWLGLGIILALAIAVVALVVGSIAASKVNTTPYNGNYIEMTTSTGQALTAGVATPMQFGTVLFASNNGADISYTSTGFTVNNDGIYDVVANAAVDVSGNTGAAPTPAPVAVWCQIQQDPNFYGLSQALPAQTAVSGTNSQYINLETSLNLDAGQSFSIYLQSAVKQLLLAGPTTTYLAITKVSPN